MPNKKFKKMIVRYEIYIYIFTSNKGTFRALALPPAEAIRSGNERMNFKYE